MKRCKPHGKPLPCFSCRSAKGGRVTSRRKTKANRKNGKLGASARWKGHRSEANEMAKKLGISRQAAWFRLRKEREQVLRQA